jgi:hypothetical protein
MLPRYVRSHHIPVWLRRHWLPTPEYCQEMTQRLQIWREMTGTVMAA